jgi:hypothetical protein
MLNETPLSTICNQALLEPLRKYHFFYDEIKDKNVEETIKLLIDLAKEAIEFDHEITKDIHDVLIDLKLANHEMNSCVISLDDLTEENKSEFTIVLDGQAINFYKVNQLQQTFNLKLEWPHNRRMPTPIELAYLEKQFSIVLVAPPNPIYYPNFAGDSFRVVPFHQKILYVVAYAWTSVHLGWIFLLIPFSVFAVMVREGDRTSMPWQATYLSSFATIFGALLCTGVTPRWAEEFKNYFVIHDPGINAVGLASSIAVISAAVVLMLVAALVKIASNIRQLIAAPPRAPATETMHLIRAQNDSNLPPNNSINHAVRI